MIFSAEKYANNVESSSKRNIENYILKIFVQSILVHYLQSTQNDFINIININQKEKKNNKATARSRKYIERLHKTIISDKIIRSSEEWLMKHVRVEL